MLHRNWSHYFKNCRWIPDWHHNRYDNCMCTNNKKWWNNANSIQTFDLVWSITFSIGKNLLRICISRKNQKWLIFVIWNRIFSKIHFDNWCVFFGKYGSYTYDFWWCRKCHSRCSVQSKWTQFPKYRWLNEKKAKNLIIEDLQENLHTIFTL